MPSTTSMVRAFIARWKGGALSPMQDKYRPDDQPNPRWPFDAIARLQFRTYTQPTFGRIYRQENDGPSAAWRSTATAIWATMPANDSEIFSRASDNDGKRTGALGERLKWLLFWLRFRDPVAGLPTNWMVADNDNNFGGEDVAQPAASNWERSYRHGDTPETLVKKAGRYGKSDTEGRFPRDPLYPARLGDLRFSAAGYNGPDHMHPHVVDFVRRESGLRLERSRIPRLALLHQDDRFAELLGAEPAPAEQAQSNSYFASLFKVDPDSVVCVDEKGKSAPVFKKAGRVRRKPLMTMAQMRAMLDDPAVPKPRVTICPTGLPRGAPLVRDSFVGGWISATKGQVAPDRWQDLSDELARRQDYDRWCGQLSDEDVKLLEVMQVASSFRDIGRAYGKDNKAAERFGKKVMQSANDNIAKIVACNAA